MSKPADLEIINMALDRIGQTNISGISDGTSLTAKCQLHYNQAVRAFLRAGRWKSCRDKVQLALVANLNDPVTPQPPASPAYQQVGGWPPGATGTVTPDGLSPTFNNGQLGGAAMPYPFQLPPDYIRIVKFNDEDALYTTYPFWEIRQDKIWSNQSTAFLEYVYDIQTRFPGVGVLDPDQVDVVTAGLAARLAWVFQQNQKLQDTLKQEYERALSRALAIDSRSEKVALRSPFEDSSWIRARVSSTDY